MPLSGGSACVGVGGGEEAAYAEGRGGGGGDKACTYAAGVRVSED